MASSSEAESSGSEAAGLRGEAQPQSWQQLTQDQRDAFRRIIELFRQTSAHLDETSSAERVRQYRSSIEFGGFEGRLNQTVLVSGERGTGKTSLQTGSKR